MEDIIAQYKDVKRVNDQMTLARNSEDEFYRILRKSFGGKNANYETYGLQYDYKGNLVTAEYFKELYDKLQQDQAFRFRPKNDREKTNITDAPGFGSVRLSPPYEEPSFDRDFFDFLSSLIKEEDRVIDYGGGTSPFLAFLPKSRKMLVDKNNLGDPLKPYGIEYMDADEYLKGEVDPESIVFCFHTLEHVDNPEELIRKFSKAGVFVFATPNEEVIDTSIYHYIFMQVPIFKKIFKKENRVAFLRTSKANLDIHGVVVNSAKKWALIRDNVFFKRNFRLYTEI